MSDYRQIIRRPLLTEKSTIEKETENVVTFAVDPRVGKIEIKQAIERLFKVKVIEVRTLRVRGKLRKVGRSAGRRPNWKKARVKLAEGETIEFFEGV